MSLLFKIQRKIHRLFLLKLLRNKRPSSSPFISGDTFRSFSKHVYEEGNVSVIPSAVNPTDIVFVETHLLNDFMKNVHPLIKNEYVLLTHNSDRNITETDLAYIDNKIIHWYAQNTTAKHPKLSALPIGLENKHYYHAGIPVLFNKIRKSIPKKSPKIFYAFNDSTNPKERSPLRAILQKHPHAVTSNWQSPPEYLKALSSFMFVASPSGNGIDCHRTWEALYLNTIPIVKRNPGNEFFQSFGLPIWIIDDWDELLAYDETALYKQYNSIMKSTADEPLWSNWWYDLITKSHA
jgi:hypothetical protein